MEFLADLGLVPVFASVTYEDGDEALVSPRAPMKLFFCAACCFVSNAAFDPSLVEYDENYDNSLHHSVAFSAYSSGLVRRLAAEYDLRDRNLIELGCGKGQFLIDLCRTAKAKGIGYDRSYDGAISDPRVTFVRDYLSWDNPPAFDFFISRHVVEHLDNPNEFLSGLRKACGSRPIRGYLEVPDAIYDFERSPWNCPYPHVSYFSATSLERLVARAGFGNLRLRRSFEGQYLAVEVGVNVPMPDESVVEGMGLHREREILANFGENFPQVVGEWRDRLARMGFERCVVWGAGTKGLGFLNAVDVERKIAGVVDSNPAKWGQYLPVTGHRIFGPEQLHLLDIETVIITNPAYQAEIESTLTKLGVDAAVVSAH